MIDKIIRNIYVEVLKYGYGIQYRGKNVIVTILPNYPRTCCYYNLNISDWWWDIVPLPEEKK